MEVLRMPTGIMIMGSSGAGKTTLGKIVAEKLGFTFIDIDDYIWRKDTEMPYSKMYNKTEKINNLMEAVSNCEHFVMAGSMTSFHEYFDPFFELVIHMNADKQLRKQRVHERELKSFGNRILVGGDMFEEHQKFLSDVQGYDYGLGGCSLQEHEEWLNALTCKKIYLDGADTLESNSEKIIIEYNQH
ncbi:MAG: shikimate kinase [Eubacteriales bacterium]|nr:shikimate kinase [Eubacteriales bacterium]